MKLKKIISVLSAAAVLGCNVIAMAAESAFTVDKIEVTDVSNAMMEVSGTLGEGKNNRTVVLYISKASDGAITNANLDKAVYIDSADVTSEGAYKFSFKFDEASDNYKVNVKTGDELITKDFAYQSRDDIKDFLVGIADKTITDVVGEMAKCEDVLGVKSADFKNDKDVNILKKRIAAKATEIKTGAQAYDFAPGVEVIKNAAYEVKQLDTIAGTLVWSVVDEEIRDANSVLGVDMTKYNSLTDAQRQSICSQVALSWTDADAFNARVSTLMTEALASADESGGSTGGSTGDSTGGSRPVYVPGANDNTREPSIIPTTPDELETTQGTFVDIAGVKWAEEAILKLANMKVIAGVGDNKFEPSREVKREELVKMIVTAFGLTAGEKADSFADVSDDAWYKSFIEIGQSNGIINGIGDGRFGVGNGVTREDLAVILYRAAVKSGMKFEEKGTFADEAQISDYAKEAVAFMSGKGIINGDEGKFMPKQTATRAQTAKMIWEILKLK